MAPPDLGECDLWVYHHACTSLVVVLTLHPSCTAAGQNAGLHRCLPHTRQQSATKGVVKNQLHTVQNKSLLLI